MLYPSLRGVFQNPLCQMGCALADKEKAGNRHKGKGELAGSDRGSIPRSNGV